jgi:GNAT superfamily N-acetyltransferase
MSSYREPQWNFLLGGGQDVTAFVVPEADGDDAEKKERGKLLGCVLQINLDSAGDDNNAGSATGFGMMLVSPAARGQGLARKLLAAAMGDQNSNGRNVLAVCSALGQPVYRKLGFSDASTITALSVSIADVRDAELTPKEKQDVDVTIHHRPFDPSIRDLFIQMDSKATGYDRSSRIRFLLDEVGTAATVGIATKPGDPSHVLAAACVRQDCPGGPITVGPMFGSSSAAVPLVKTLAAARPVVGDEVKLFIMIADNPDLVDRFLSIKGFTQMFDCPAMSQDGEPIYKGGDGTYLALLHPTLG